MAEQFHLSRLQIINWGVFDGYHTIPFSAGGSLVAGASGSGKSSLLDAISLGFLPFNRRNFNASGDNTAAGSSAGRRTVDKYVRGAWGQRSEAGTSQVMYLRGDGTTWSAVAVTYTSNTGRTITGLVLKWLTGESRSDSSSRFVIGDGDLDIEDVCNRWAAGRFDTGVFKDVRGERSDGKNTGWRFTTKVESQYLAQLYASIGIRASDAAQQLLGKAKSLKSVGGLEQFVREFMLDEPDSLARLPEALKQIDPLVEARELLAVAQRKRKILGDIEAIQVRYAAESTDLGIIDLVDLPMVRAYTDHVRLRHCPAEIQTLDTTIDQLEHEHADLTKQLNLAKAEGDSLNAQINGASANVGPLQAQVTTAESQADEVARRRAGYEDMVTALGVEVPDTADEFWNLREELTRQATEMLGKLEWGRDASTDAEYAQKSARILRDNAAKELKRVEHVGSALPESAVTMRDHICAGVGIDPAELPYVAELFDLQPEHTRWRLAVEKVLRSVGLRLLVPDQHYAKVLRFVNETNMRGRLALHHVRAGASGRQAEPNTLAGKLFLVKPKHACAAEAADVIAAAGDHICVDTPDVFVRFRRAVTDTGLYKDSDRLAIKDDRRPIKPSEYIYQGDISAKLEALHAELTEAEEAFSTARRAADEIAAGRQRWRDRAAACKAVYEQFPQWSQIDIDTAEGHADRLREQYELLLADHPDIEALSARAEECWVDIQTLMTRRGAIQTRRDDLDARRTRLMDLQDRLSPANVSEHATDLLRRYAAEVPVPLELLNPEPHREALFAAIRRERDQLTESRRRSYEELSRIVTTFDTSFPDAVPNDSDDFDERIYDYVAVCRHIDERELPDAYDRMMRLITEQAPDAILTLHRVAEQETRRISEQIDRVNTGLGAVEFNRGTRLTLRANPRAMAAVSELTDIVKAISRRIAEVGLGDKKAILEQYADILRLRNRLAGNNPEDRAWTRDALDVRNRFTFDCAEWDVANDELIRTHSNAGDNSGGEQEKLMAFCLAGALSFNLANPESDDNKPVFAQLMLDEAFSKSDPQFASQALQAFRKFGFQLVIVATVQNATTIQPYIDGVVMVSKSEATGRGARPVANVATKTITDFTALRRELPVPEPV
ncbi:AAA family ATPase [Mycobacterium sp. CBMA293]|uniref:ATP-binding protein n=1 Tax=unclassified Mycolicibacterium TaxID=2636767 RepID=UPI0012DBDEEA|nr:MULTISPECIES: SbcC/MukB-like Walker B domain-containing protein [unclassified Mycolicibacterium]MUL44502.1 AAA family ATPase [Mycolicibacterium sp. CBMA 360]MUL59822.1 AAA family ATPase [Mycolicibacterium sp. CBMA 335]MUL68665.1 AAA family ATPase [Mycolicibacterium sp. CBMA 311]MUL93944.1 AAA family ATPase [Mycolicibacterium sp. CBMA 230]MUM06190.1 nuclease [Mycolicibacterium sp. CBMA 213]